MLVAVVRAWVLLGFPLCLFHFYHDFYPYSNWKKISSTERNNKNSWSHGYSPCLWRWSSRERSGVGERATRATRDRPSLATIGALISMWVPSTTPGAPRNRIWGHTEHPACGLQSHHAGVTKKASSRPSHCNSRSGLHCMERGLGGPAQMGPG